MTSQTGAATDFLFGFTGRWLDQDTGLQNNHHRWYDARVGRWLSEDPLSFDAGDTNLYRYCGNDPVGNVDPSGLGFKGIMGAVGSALASGFGAMAGTSAYESYVPPVVSSASQWGSWALESYSAAMAADPETIPITFLSANMSRSQLNISLAQTIMSNYPSAQWANRYYQLLTVSGAPITHDDVTTYVDLGKAANARERGDSHVAEWRYRMNPYTDLQQYSREVEAK